MAEDDIEIAEVKDEKAEESPLATVEKALTSEANEGTPAWLEEKKRETAELRKGRSSGISLEFGKPSFAGPLQNAALARTGDAAVGQPESKEALETGQITLKPITIVGELPYAGEGTILKDVPPGAVTAGKSETVETIARRQLGPEASKQEVAAYVKEISKVNELGLPPQLQEGQKLKLPGHTKDGGFVTIDDQNKTTTRWKDGSSKVEHPEPHRHWVLTQPIKGGGYREEHGGSARPEENFTLEKTKDGYFRLGDKDGLRQPADLNEIFKAQDSPGHKRLDQLAEEKIKDPERLAKFRADMLRFEERMRSRDLSAFEIESTYKEIGRLLEAQGDQPLKGEDRVKIAQQVMSQVATPSSIDQGRHETCNVTTVESRIYTRDPATAAKLVADVATTGQFTTADGLPVKVSPQSLQPDLDAKGNPPKDGERSHASQVFEVTAVNIAYARKNAETNPPGNVRYEQYRPGEKDATGKMVGYPPADSGERLIDYAQNPPKEYKDFYGRAGDRPNITDDQIVEVNNAITGESDYEDIVIDHKDNVESWSKKVTKIETEAQLNEKIAKLAKEGKLPVIVGVDAHMEPFYSDSDGGIASGSAGAHVITITGYSAGPPARVAIDGQWGSKSDHSGGTMVNMHELYLAMQPPDKAVVQMKADVDANKADTSEKLQYLRLSDGKSPAYQDKVLNCMLEEEKRWKQNPNDPEVAADHARAMRTFRTMLKQLSRDQQDAMVKRLLAEAPQDELLKKEQERIASTPVIFKVR